MFLNTYVHMYGTYLHTYMHTYNTPKIEALQRKTKDMNWNCNRNFCQTFFQYIQSFLITLISEFIELHNFASTYNCTLATRLLADQQYYERVNIHRNCKS
jgi:hypothetical protein